MATILTNHERPGVYSGYDISSIVQSGSGGKAVAVAALCESDTVCKSFYQASDAAAFFGSDSVMAKMIALAFANGAYLVYAQGVADDGDFAAAYEALLKCEHVGVLVSDRTAAAELVDIRNAVIAASADQRECIAVAATGEEISSLLETAALLNSERMLLLGHNGTQGSDALFAAAAAGCIAAMSDPSVPLGGAILSGTLPDCGSFTENEIDALVRGGITPIEYRSGSYEIVRGITTCTKVGESSDSTWRELSVVLIVDNVISTLRESLRAGFQRVKNTEQTRGAIRSQVIVELENKKAKEIIGDYDSVVVSVPEDQPTVARVEFAFSVTHGLNQIWLAAHITV